MLKLLDFIESSTGITPDLQIKLFNSLGIIILLWLLKVLAVKLVWRRTDDVHTRYFWRKSITYIVVILGIILVGREWISGLRNMGTFLGLLSAGIAIALRDPVADIAGWLFIIARRPFTIGDRVQIGEHSGDVIDIRVFQFTLMEIGNWVDADQSTGRVIHIPNLRIFTHTLSNYSKGFQYIWNEIPVLITFESNWRKAKEILTDIANGHAADISKLAEEKVKEASRKFLIFYSKLTPIVYTAVKDSGVMLTIRYLCEPRTRRGTSGSIWEAILDEFAKHDDIDFAYPTTRMYLNPIEGKPGTVKHNPDNGNDQEGL